MALKQRLINISGIAGVGTGSYAKECAAVWTTDKRCYLRKIFWNMTVNATGGLTTFRDVWAEFQVSFSPKALWTICPIGEGENVYQSGDIILNKILRSWIGAAPNIAEGVLHAEGVIDFVRGEMPLPEKEDIFIHWAAMRNADTNIGVVIVVIFFYEE